VSQADLPATSPIRRTSSAMVGECSTGVFLYGLVVPTCQQAASAATPTRGLGFARAL
jgi:hypothetical protein